VRCRLTDGAGAAFAAGEDIENPYLGGGDGGSGGEEKKKTPAKKKAKAKAPEPVIPAHLLNKNKNKAKRTEMRNVEGNAPHMTTHTHARARNTARMRHA
jgi:hypothetical protein